MDAGMGGDSEGHGGHMDMGDGWRDTGMLGDMWDTRRDMGDTWRDMGDTQRYTGMWGTHGGT